VSQDRRAGAADRRFATPFTEYQLAFDDERLTEADVQSLAVVPPHRAG
jgi:hypothetical protein